MLNGKATIILLTVGLIEKTQYKWVNIFQTPKHLAANVKVELNLSNYTTKANLKNAMGVDTSKFAKNVALASLKSDVDKLKNVGSNLKNLKS